MIETIIAAAALAAMAQADDDRTARAISECGFAESDVTTIEADSVSGFDDFGTQLEAALGEKIVVIGGDLTGADMRGLSGSLPGICFYQTKLSGTDWRGNDLISSRFVGVDLSGANFEGTYLTNARLVGVDASAANFANAKLGSAKWIGQNWTSNLEGASFAGADMNYFTFDCGITMDMSCGGSSGADFSGADLSNADLASYPIWGFDTFKGAKLERAYISPRAVKYLDEVTVGRSITLGYRRDEVGDRRPQVRLTGAEFAELKSSVAAQADVPSFDCAKASIQAEHLICGEYESELRRMDRDMAKLYAQAKAAGAVDVAGQRAFLKQRNACEDTECITNAYEERMDDLFAGMGVELALAPDATLQFEDDVLPVSDDMRGSALYAKVTPAIRMFSMSSVQLTGREDGSIAAQGEAVGGNAHTCSLGADQLVYDPKTGWYSAQGEGDMLIPILRVWEHRLFFRYSGNADTPDEAQNIISCGMRAAFGEMRELGK